MASLNYDRFVRFLERCVELAAAPGKPAVLGIVFKARLEAPATAFLQAEKAVNKALADFTKENREAVEALDALDRPYRTARSVVVAMLPETVLPETLKAQPTDTDKLNAITELLDIIDDNVGEPWADELLQGDFGQQAPKTAKELNEAIVSSSARSDALTARAMAFGPAYEAYQAFKLVARAALGPSSSDYRRIHLRASPGSRKKATAPAKGKKADKQAETAAEATKPAGTGTGPEPAAPPPPPEDTKTPPDGE